MGRFELSGRASPPNVRRIHLVKLTGNHRISRRKPDGRETSQGGREDPWLRVLWLSTGLPWSWTTAALLPPSSRCKVEAKEVTEWEGSLRELSCFSSRVGVASSLFRLRASQPKGWGRWTTGPRLSPGWVALLSRGKRETLFRIEE